MTRFPRTNYCKEHSHVHSGGEHPHCYSCEHEYRAQQDRDRQSAAQQGDDKAFADYDAALKETRH